MRRQWWKERVLYWFSVFSIAYITKGHRDWTIYYMFFWFYLQIAEPIHNFTYLIINLESKE